MRATGEMPEWPNGTDSKSVVLATVPRVQIPISPPYVVLQGPWRPNRCQGPCRFWLRPFFVPCLGQTVVLTLPFLYSGISVTILETFQPQPAPPGSARGNVRCFPSSSIQPLKQTSAEGHEQLRSGPPWPSKPATFDFNNAHLASSPRVMAVPGCRDEEPWADMFY